MAKRNRKNSQAGKDRPAEIPMTDLSTDNFEQEVSVDLMKNEQQVLLAIRAALDRIDAGTYGVCERCCHEIPEERLQALAYAVRCVKDEEQAEKDGDVDLGP